MSGGVSVIIDSWAAIAFLRREGSADVSMRRYIKRADKGNLRLLMNLINLGETFYRMAQMIGENEADERLQNLRMLPIEIFPVKEPLVMDAARLKASYRISYADAIAVATARQEKGSVLTGDPEIIALPREVVRVIKLDR